MRDDDFREKHRTELVRAVENTRAATENDSSDDVVLPPPTDPSAVAEGGRNPLICHLDVRDPRVLIARSAHPKPLPT